MPRSLSDKIPSSTRNRVLLSAATSVLGIAGLDVATAHAALTAPAGVAPGATFRYLYLTTATTPATSPLAATYNTVAANDASGAGYTSYNGTALTWSALVSTSAASAGSLIPAQDAFFLPNGTEIAASTSSLFNANNVPLLEPVSTANNQLVWTGTTSSGASGGVMGSASKVTPGITNTTNGAWLYAAASPPTATSEAIYAFSNELTVSAVPEPTSLAVIGLPAAIALLRRRSTKASI